MLRSKIFSRIIFFGVLILLIFTCGCADANVDTIADTTPAPPSEIVETSPVETNKLDMKCLPFLIDEIIWNAGFTDDVSQYQYTNWKGIDVSTELELILEGYHPSGSYYAINVFRRNGDDFFENFIYDGKTLQQFRDEQNVLGEKLDRLSILIEHYGEILKYDKNVLITTGIPTDDPDIIYEKGEIWPEWMYDKQVAYFNEIDPNMLSRYIVDGDFLYVDAERDYNKYYAEWITISSKMQLASEAFFSQNELTDVDLFQNAGIISGKVNGKLYIIVTREQFENLYKKMDLSMFSFSCMPRENFNLEYPTN